MTFLTGGIVTNILRVIIEWLGQTFANLAMILSGISFNAIQGFTNITSEDGVVQQILHPVYAISKNVFVPIAVELLGLLLAWNFIKVMLGKFSSIQEDPIRLFGRAIVFLLLIGASFTFIDNVSDIVIDTTNSIINAPAGASSTDLTEWKSRNTSSYSAKVIDDMYVWNGIKGEKKSLSDDINDDYDSDSKDNKLEVIGSKNSSKTNKATKNKDKKNKKKTKTEKKKNYKSSTWRDASDIGASMIETSVSDVGASLFGGVIFILYGLIYGVMTLLIAWQALKCCLVFIRRLTTFLISLYMAPLAFAAGPSKSTQNIFDEWVRMISAYAITLFISAGFLSCARFVIAKGFQEAGKGHGDVPLFLSTAFCYTVVFMFLKIINNIEDYVNRLGFNAVGFNDREGVAGFLQHAGTMMAMRMGMSSVRGGGRFGGRGGLTSKLGNEGGLINGAVKGLSNKLGQGARQKQKFSNALNKKDAVSDAINGSKNGASFVKSAGGKFGRGIDGKMHELDSNGKALDGTSIVGNDRYDANKGGLGLKKGFDGKLSKAFSGTGDYVLSGDGSVATNIGDLAHGKDFGKHLKDSEGNAYTGVGDAFAETKDGKMVNVGSHDISRGADGLNTYKAGDTGYITPKFQTDLSGNGGFASTIGNGQQIIRETASFDTNLSDNASFINPDAVDFGKDSWRNALSDQTSSVSGIAEQTLSDGTVVNRPYEAIPVNELNKDRIESLIANSSGTDECQGFTGDQKFYIMPGDPIKSKSF